MMEKLRNLKVGRIYALLIRKCPLKTKESNLCIDCPDGCPLINPHDPKNNPEEHPELFDE